MSGDSGVYMVPCNDRPKVYFGESGHFSKRILEHKYDIRRANDQSSIFSHVRDFNHTLDFNNSKISFKSENHILRRIVESTLISEVSNFNQSSGHYKVNPLIRTALLPKTFKRLQPDR